MHLFGLVIPSITPDKNTTIADIASPVQIVIAAPPLISSNLLLSIFSILSPSYQFF